MKKIVKRLMLLSVMLGCLGFIWSGNIISVQADPPCFENCYSKLREKLQYLYRGLRK